MTKVVNDISRMLHGKTMSKDELRALLAEIKCHMTEDDYGDVITETYDSVFIER